MSRIPIAIVVAQAGGRVLMRRRPGAGAMAGLWEFPGGKIQAGEDAVTAALRELAEETGLAPLEAPGELLTLPFDYPDRKLLLHFFRCRCESIEVAGWRWIDARAVADLPMPEANRAVVARLSAGNETRSRESS